MNDREVIDRYSQISARHRREFRGVANRLAKGDPLWPAQLTLAIAIFITTFLSQGVRIGPVWLAPTIEGAMLLLFVIFGPRRIETESVPRRNYLLALVGLVALTNIVSLTLLIHYLITGGNADGEHLILSGVILWVANVLVFAVMFWMIDRGGPLERFLRPDTLPDFQFPQMENPQLTIKGWRPAFFDYLYMSLTNSTAFSPTDAMPLTVTAKTAMAVESIAAFMTTGLVVARAVNILG